MDARLFLEPQQGTTYDQQLVIARAAETAGFSALFRSDHFLKMGDVDGLPGPTDAWVTLAGLARETESIRLGTLVTSATFRHGGLLAVTVAQVDQMSGGRVELGLGAGWFEAEHLGHGVPFPALGDRFDLLEDQLAIITGMWATPVGENFDHTGPALSVSGSPGLPKPAQSPRPPIVVGGRGPNRTPRLAATYADEFNQAFEGLEQYRTQLGRVRAACEARDRDPDSIVQSIALIVCCGEDEAAVRRRASAVGREPDELRENGAAGTPEEVVAKIASYADAGAQRIYLQFLDLSDLEQIQLLGKDVLPELAML
ncbi:MAG: LLM class F420-dependent oxidoreductase [Actinomycetota bacterium]